jgi:uncharacterized protein YbaR (Trm112 family)
MAMAIRQELLDILVCPVPECRVPVKLTPDGQGLKCSKCHRVYPIMKVDLPEGEPAEIPVMIIDQARIEAE